jgi:hypothetical protein
MIDFMQSIPVSMKQVCEVRIDEAPDAGGKLFRPFGSRAG